MARIKDEAGNALATAGARIIERHTARQLAGIDAEEHETTNERVVPKFEGKASQLGLVADDGLDRVAIAVLTLHRRNVDGAWKIINNAIEETLHTLLLERQNRETRR